MFFVFWNPKFLSQHAMINIFRFSPKTKSSRCPSLKNRVYHNQSTKVRFSPFYELLRYFLLFSSTHLCYTLRKVVFFISSTFSGSGSTPYSDTIAMERCGEGLGCTPPGCHQLNIWIFWQILEQEPVRPHSLQVPLQKLQWLLQRGCSLGEL